MSQPHKICPRCKAPADLQVPQCRGCGRQFRTSFASDDQTMLGGSLPPSVPTYSASSASGGPLDNTERNVSMVWTSIGLAFTSLWLLAIVSVLVKELAENETTDAVYSMLALIVSAWLLSFLLMRFRRLYLSSPSAFSPVEVAQRRGRFSVNASIGVTILAILAFGVGVLQVEQQRSEQAKVQAAQEKAASEIRQMLPDLPSSAIPDPTPLAPYTPPPSSGFGASPFPAQGIIPPPEPGGRFQPPAPVAGPSIRRFRDASPNTRFIPPGTHGGMGG